MKRLRILIVGTGLTCNDIKRVKQSLVYFVQESILPLSDEQRASFAEELSNSLTFEDVVAKKDIHQIWNHASTYGYLLLLGNDAIRKLEATQFKMDVVECHTLRPAEWTGKMREHVIGQLKTFVNAWINATTETKVAELVKSDEHKTDWILQNLDQFKRHIQLMITNDRPHVAMFQKGKTEYHCILKDATKRLKQPLNEIVPVVVENAGVREKILKNLEQNGYSKVFIMEIDEFINHVKSICLQLNGQPVHIMVEPTDAPNS